MQNSEFEKSVQQQMNELKIPPRQGLWDRIEPKLPAPKKDRRWAALLFLFAILTAASLYTWTNMGSQKNGTDRRNNTQPSPVSAGGQGTPQNADRNSSSTPVVTGKVYGGNDTNSTRTNSQLAGAPIIQGPLEQTQPASRLIPDGETSNLPKKSSQGKYPSKTSVNTFEPGTENGDKSVANLQDVDPLPKQPGEVKGTIPVVAMGTDTAMTKDILTTKEIVTDTIGILKAKVPNVFAGSTKPWEYGIHMGAGISTVKNKLFSSSGVFADAPGNLSSGNPGNIPQTAPKNPGAAASFEAGLYLKKQLNTRWAFTTGLNYAYLSTTIQTGMRVDSPAIVIFSTRSLDASNYFPTGSGSTYRNKFHLLDLPLLLGYEFPGKLPLSAQFGTTVGYLLNSDAIIYSRSISGYVTDADVFNKILVSLDAGAAINLEKLTRRPMNLGYRFRYSLGSATKKAFGAQHLLNSTFYLDIPLKK